MKPNEAFWNVLQSQQKNINDLISQELMLMWYAQFLEEFPEWEEAQTETMHRIHIHTCQTLENLFWEIYPNEWEQISEEEKSRIRGLIQEFVHAQLERQSEKIADYQRIIRRIRGA